MNILACHLKAHVCPSNGDNSLLCIGGGGGARSNLFTEIIARIRICVYLLFLGVKEGTMNIKRSCY